MFLDVIVAINEGRKLRATDLGIADHNSPAGFKAWWDLTDDEKGVYFDRVREMWKENGEL